MPISIAKTARQARDPRFDQKAETPCARLDEAGAVLRTRRKELGWSQDFAAEVCGFNQRMISEIERGKRDVSFTRVALYAQRLGIDIVLRISEKL